MQRTLISLSLLLLGATACRESDGSNDAAPATPAPIVDSAGATVTGANSVASTNSDKEPLPVANIDAGVEPSPVVAIQVDATSKTDWAYFDLDSLKVVAATDATWDLAFKRTSIKMNSDVKAIALSGVAFDALAKAPEGIYAGDAAVAGSAMETDGLFFHTPVAWYAYDINLHVISSNNFVYVLKSNGGQDIKLAVTDYYDGDRLPALIQLKTQILGKSAAAE